MYILIELKRYHCNIKYGNHSKGLFCYDYNFCLNYCGRCYYSHYHTFYRLFMFNTLSRHNIRIIMIVMDFIIVYYLFVCCILIVLFLSFQNIKMWLIIGVIVAIILAIIIGVAVSYSKTAQAATGQ